ncbi:MAG: hypothetical protein PXZ08_03205 [Actinomycetota bacterium]|jgi:hypothetical protein|nr:hypothetical protein [Actinomycetota bacterium]
MTRSHGLRRKSHDRGCGPTIDGVTPTPTPGLPTCSTGPFSRAAWVFKEISNILHGRD